MLTLARSSWTSEPLCSAHQSKPGYVTTPSGPIGHTYAHNLVSAQDELGRIGITINNWNRQHAVKHEKAANAQQRYERDLYDSILCQSNWNAHKRVRQKITRWKHADTPRREADTTLENLRRIGQLAPPRVTAACIGTVCNKWASERRMQRRNTHTNKCIFHCRHEEDPPGPEDSLEHYWHCTVLQGIFNDEGFKISQFSPKEILLLNGKLTELELIRASAACYATMKSTTM